MSSETNLQLDPTKIENSPKTQIVKIAHFGNVMSIDMTLPKVGDFYNGGGLWGNSMSFVGSN